MEQAAPKDAPCSGWWVTRGGPRGAFKNTLNALVLLTPSASPPPPIAKPPPGCYVASVVPGTLSTAICSGLPVARGPAILSRTGTKSRETIYGTSIRAAAERAAEARKQADRLACEAWNKRMLGFQGPAQGLPNTKVGTLTQALYDEAKKINWTVIGMKNDWKKIFSFE